MNLRILIATILLTVLLAGCSKIRLKKLAGYWDVVSWTLTDTNNVEQDGLLLFPNNVGDDNVVSFTESHEILIFAFTNDTISFAENGFWEETSGFYKITFTDSVYMFNTGKKYSFDKLSRDDLELSGTFVTGTDSFPRSVIVLKRRE